MNNDYTTIPLKKEDADVIREYARKNGIKIAYVLHELAEKLKEKTNRKS